MTCKPNDTHYAGCACHEARHASEIIRLEHELAKKSRLQQAVDIARQTIRDQRAEIGRLVTRLEAARDEIHNANLRADRALRDRNEVGARMALIEDAARLPMHTTRNV